MIKHKYILITFALVLIAVGAFAQINGPTQVTTNSTVTYTCSLCSGFGSPYWYASNGTILSSSGSSSVTVQWASDAGTGLLQYRNRSTVFNSLTVSISNPTPPPPTPATPNVSYGCGTATLSFNGSPPSGTTWYWQGTNSSGTSTSNSSSSYHVSSNGFYYLRAKNSSEWSVNSAVVSIALNSDTPGNPSTTGAVRCQSGSVTLTGSSNSDRWYTGPSGGSHFHTGNSYTTTVSSSQTYYVEAVSPFGCVSAGRTPVMATVYSASNGGTLAVTAGQSHCVSGTVSLSVSGKNGTIQNWQYRYRVGSDPWPGTWNNFGTSSTTASLAVSQSGNEVRQYQFKVLVKNGTCSADASNTVMTNVHPQPVVFAGNTINAFTGNSAFSLAGYGESPTGGSWSGSHESNNQFDPISSGFGNYAVAYTYTDGNGCTNTDTKTVAISTPPSIQIPGNNYVELGGTTALTLPGYTSYQWKFESVNLPGATGSTLQATEPGNYSVVVTNADGFSVETGSARIYSSMEVQNHNLITTRSYRIPTTDKNYEPTGIEEVQESTTYFDGIGRKMQTVVTQGSPDRYDMVQPITYDSAGRQAISYLPYTASDRNGHHKSVALTDQLGFYQNSSAVAVDNAPYAETVFEASPLNRPKEQGAAGTAWQPGQATVTYSYEVNSSADAVLNWDIDASDNFEAINLFTAGQLSKTITTDEEGHAVIEFVNKLGQTVLKRVQAVQAPDMTTYSPGEWADTYYVYDDFGNLRYVLPPEAIKAIGSPSTFPYTPSPTLLDNWAFQYQYDGRRRMTEKKVPGAEPVKMIYDDRDRLVLTQDGNQRNDNKWLFTKYDALNRPIITGEKVLTASESTLRDLLDGPDWLQNYAAYETLGGDKFGYTSNSLPKNITTDEILTVTYYDDYTFPHASTYPFVPELGNTAFDQVKGQITGVKVKILDGSNTWLDGVTYYDNRYRVIQSQTETLLGGVDRVTNRYDFIGQELETRTTHEGPKIFDIQWIDVIGVTVEDDNSLTKSTNSGWSNGGAASANILSAGEDGWIEMEVAETNLARMFGLSDINQNEHYNTIDYAIYPNLHGQVLVFENGVNRGSKGTYQTGDKLSVERVGNQIFYKKNGTLLYPSTISSTTSLIVDVSLYNVSSTIKSPKASFGLGDDTSSDIIITRTFDYDHAGRLINTWHKINDEDSVLLAHNAYNELGELIEKNLHQTSPAGGGAGGGQFAQSIDYRYNIRGWLTLINNAQLTNTAENNDTGQAADYWGMELGYNNALTGVTATATYNGNISAVKWSDNLGLGNATNIKERAYAYTYDPMNRIKTAQHSQYTSAWTANNHFKLDGLTYDLNGNIDSLIRKGQQGNNMDVLAYTYAGNQLLRVTDSGDDNQGFKDGTNPGDDYLYDANGNMTQDLNKDITSIIYNHLNLPERVEKDANNYILYTYDASGIKLRQDVYQDGALTKTTDYVGEFIYENDELQLIQHEEGRYIPPSGGNEGGVYQYHLKDHLGNTRVTFTTLPETFEFQATMESENATDEEALFSNLAETRATYLNANHTAGGNEAVRLNQTKPVGPALSLPVGAGDIVDLEV